MAIRRHFLALFVSTLILLLGFLMGTYVENLRVEQTYREINLQRHEFDTILLEYQYITQLKDMEKCDFVWEAYYKNLVNLDKKRARLETYRKESKIDIEKYDLAKADYINTEVRYWMLSKDLEEVCPSNATTILYFFADKDECSACEDQGDVLTYLKSRYKRQLLVFSVDANQKGVIDLLKSQYNITTYPVLIVNGKKYGYLTSDELIPLIEKKAGKGSE